MIVNYLSIFLKKTWGWGWAGGGEISCLRMVPKSKGIICAYVYIMYIIYLDIWGTQEPLLLSWPCAIQTKEVTFTW